MSSSRTMNQTITRIAAAVGLIALALGLQTGCSTTLDSDFGAEVTGAPGAPQTDRCASCAELASGSWDGPMLATSACPGPERIAYDVLAGCVADTPQCHSVCPISIGQNEIFDYNYISVPCWNCLRDEGCTAELIACALGPSTP